MGIYIKKGQKLPSGGYEVDHTTNVIAVAGGKGDLVWTASTSQSDMAEDLEKHPEGRRMTPETDRGPDPARPSPARRRASGTSGPFPIRAYALAIILGVVAAIWVGEKRWVARGGKPGQVGDIALWAVPAGLIGARLYHVATDHDLYFGQGGDPLGALEVWHGGLGIWGAIAGGLLGAWLYTRRHDIRLRVLADSLAPGLLLAQAIGRFGNYFNQELYGRPTDAAVGPGDRARTTGPSGTSFPVGTTFHPTFLYEALWNLAGHRPAALPRPPLQARLRPGVRDLRDDLHRRPRLDRVAADRHHRARQRARAALGRVDVDHPVRRRRGVLRPRPGAGTGRRTPASPRRTSPRRSPTERRQPERRAATRPTGDAAEPSRTTDGPVPNPARLRYSSRETAHRCQDRLM